MTAGLRALLWVWAAVLLALAGGVATLQVLGPPPGETPEQVALATPAPAPAAPPTPTPTPTPAPSLAPSLAPSVAPAPSPQASAPPAPPASADGGAAVEARAPGAAIPAPIAALLEPSGLGDGSMLPRIGPDGLAPMRAYAGGAPAIDARPRVAILLADFAMREADSEEAMRRLPVAVSVVLSPYAARPASMQEQARAAGREVWLSVPMEPRGFPLDDPGNRALLTGAAPAQNAAALRWVLSRAEGYAGTTGALGSLRGERYAASGQMGALLEELGRRGLMYVDPRVDGALPPPPPGTPPAPRRAVDVVIDEPAVRTEIEAKLERLEQLARDRGSALGLASAPVPVTVERLAAWTALLAQRGVLLVPASALVLPAK
jgi:polysaccharide deacetylase 2 family uncharacterized protein YibQ